MANLLFVVFLVEIAVVLVNTIGTAAINDFIWKLYIASPIGNSNEVKEQRELQKRYLAVRKDLNATSSQDEFAKWAKLRRQHDKLFEQLEAKKKSLDGGRATFDRTLSTTQWVLLKVLPGILPFWYSRTPMFWLPHGFFPYYAEWLISFPRAPLGSVSIMSWQVACKGVLGLLRDTIGAAYALIVDARQGKGREAPLKASTEKPGAKPSSKAGSEAKKDL